MGAVELRPTYGDAVIGSLDDGVLLRVEASAEFVPLARRDAQLLA